MKENLILKKSFNFSLRILKTFQLLRRNKVERDICVQLLNCGTSIGANVEEAVGAVSRKDFRCKLQIAYKEARETKYWLRLFMETQLLEKRLADSLLDDCEEILKILGSILRTLKPDTVNS